MPILAPDAVLTPEGFVRDVVVDIEGGQVRALTSRDRFPGVPDVPLAGRVVVPGLVNAHSHAFQRALRGRTGGADFWRWRTEMYDLVAGLDPEALEAISALAFTEMVEAGITHVGEFHYVHHQADGTPYADPDELAHRVIAAARTAGLRITLLRVAYERNGADPLVPAQRRFVDAPESVLAAAQRLRHAYDDPTVTVGLAPHSVRALPPASLRALAAFEGPIHVHVSEQPQENEFCRATTGRSPTELLEACGLVGPRFTAVHLTWPERGDVERLRKAGARVCACPSTELDLADGFLPVEVRRTLPLCLGSDSHLTIDLFAEARTLEAHGRAQTGRRGVLGQAEAEPIGGEWTARAFAAATTEGQRALGIEAHDGIRPGDPADLVAIDVTRLTALGVPWLDAIVGLATPDWVDRVWVGGRPLVVDGRHVRADAVRRAAQAIIATGSP